MVFVDFCFSSKINILKNSQLHYHVCFLKWTTRSQNDAEGIARSKMAMKRDPC